ncbi:hypothetical protein PENANT_c046G03185 [Penicillium antarcticum]|uniref:Uncharacterized protein n=1 Tax=Penicillium antarcticum TaxID=416450 RepID=A0A1V6PRS5_9EURO|nr:hypothetical protein PENANT_c046G03185 [Penicillium antarcticum]
MTLKTASTTTNTTITITETNPKESVPPRTSPLTQILHHSHVTTDFDPHRFQAAAAQQLQPRRKSQETDTRLITSPYNSATHLLDISKLEQQDRLLALALTYLKPTRADYATAPYTESFNWTEVFELLKAFSESEDLTWKRRSYYVVIFRSTLLPDVDSDYLYALDAHSHREAMASGGLLKYWFGAKDELGRNLATCEYGLFVPFSYFVGDSSGLYLFQVFGGIRMMLDLVVGGRGMLVRELLRQLFMNRSCSRRCG